VTQPSDRLIGSLEAVIAALLPKLAYYAQWGARVASVESGPPVVITCVPTSALGLSLLGPTIVATLCPGADGGYATPLPGTLVRISFVDASPANPEIVRLDPNAVPATITLGSPDALPVVPTTWAVGLLAALETFSSGLTPATLTAQAAALSSALGVLPIPATVTLLAS
jgi:hypothetical protein